MCRFCLGPSALLPLILLSLDHTKHGHGRDGHTTVALTGKHPQPFMTIIVSGGRATFLLFSSLYYFLVVSCLRKLPCLACVYRFSLPRVLIISIIEILKIIGQLKKISLLKIFLCLMSASSLAVELVMPLPPRIPIFTRRCCPLS